MEGRLSSLLSCCIAPRAQICQSRSGDIEPGFSGKSLLPCPNHFKKSVFTANLGSIPFLPWFHSAGKQDEVLELSAAFWTPLRELTRPLSCGAHSCQSLILTPLTLLPNFNKQRIFLPTTNTCS